MTRFLFLVGFLCLTGCAEHQAKPTKPQPPAKVEKLPVETEIARITLTPEARQRLGITTAQVTEQIVSQRRTLGGDVMIPAGKAIMVSAPYPGTIVQPEKNTIPAPGQHVAAGDPILSIAPLLTPERDVPTPAERVQIANARATLLSALTVARGDIERTNAEVDAAKIAFDRATILLDDRVGTQRAVDDAKAQLIIAKTGCVAAQQQAKQLENLLTTLDPPGGIPGDATPLVVGAPQAGVVRILSVTPGQTVGIGAPLFEVVSTDTMWIRVPVYVEMLTTIVADAPAHLVGLDGRHPATPRIAIPVAAPPSADSASSTADLYYATENHDGALRPGQRVGVELLLAGEQNALTIPAKSLLYDIYGGTWVYEQSGEFAYERRRVLVRFTDGDQVVISAGPAAGTTIVVDGTAELYGTEFGSGK